MSGLGGRSTLPCRDVVASLNVVELEERTIEQLPDRCENCGATLTREEKQRILDEGASAALCTICAAEATAIPDEEAEGGDAAY